MVIVCVTGAGGASSPASLYVPPLDESHHNGCAAINDDPSAAFAFTRPLSGFVSSAPSTATCNSASPLPFAASSDFTT